MNFSKFNAQIVAFLAAVLCIYWVYGLYPAASPASDVLHVVTTAQSWEP